MENNIKQEFVKVCVNFVFKDGDIANGNVTTVKTENIDRYVKEKG